MSFDWQTEEEFNWDEPDVQPEPPKRKRRRWPWFLLLGVVLTGTAVFLLFRQLDQRIEVATDDIEADLIASYAVLQQAAVNKDENLFNSLLSGRELDWSQAQRQNLNEDVLLNRTGFGLEWQPGLVETAVISQTFSPELVAAELTTQQRYSLNIGNGLTQTVQLTRTDVYRLGEDRWLLAPPEQAFWGVRRRFDGELLNVRYYTVDADIVQRLAADLEAKLVQLCAAPGLVCPVEMRIRLNFSREPDSLTQATFMGAFTQARESRFAILTGGQAVVLPTPSLVGLPQDEVGYQALLRGYTTLFLLPVLNDLAGWECCVNVLFYQAAVSRQLYELGVGEWPLLDLNTWDTAVSLPVDLTLGEGLAYWQAPFPETPSGFLESSTPYAIVDFLASDLHVPSSRIATSLARSGKVTMWQWLSQINDGTQTEAALNQAFREYVFEKQGEPVSLPQPEAGLTLLCQNNFGGEAGLYYYDFSLEMPILMETVTGSDPYITQLPNGTGVAVVARSASGQPETYLWQNDGTRIDVAWNNVEGITSRPPLAIPTTTDPNGRYLLWTVTQGFATGTFYALTDLEACKSGDGCEAISIGGYPVWSPNSEKIVTLTVTNPWWSEGLTNGLMLLRDEPVGEPINSPGFGSSIFWLDDDQFGYLIQFQNGQQQLVLADNDLARPEIILDSDSLQSFAESTTLPRPLRIQFAVPLLIEPDSYLIVAEPPSGEDGTFFLMYNQAENSFAILSWSHPSTSADEIGVRVSPNGRFVQMMFPDADMSSWGMTLYDVEGQQIFFHQIESDTQFPHHFYSSWSPDGEWLAVPEMGSLRLWHNGWDERLLTFDALSCSNAAWVNKIVP